MTLPRRAGTAASLAAVAMVAVGMADAVGATSSTSPGETPAGPAARTEQKRFLAWRDGEPTLPIKARRNLDCNSSSYVNPRRDAWRCFGRRYIYDPCFENLAELEYGELLCVGSPWDRSGVLGFSALDYDDRFRGPQKPWALRLRSGLRCRFVSGATTGVRGRRLNYICKRPPRVCPCLFGLPDRSRPTWRIFQASPEGQNWRRVPIATAWR